MNLVGWRKILFGTEVLGAGTFLCALGRLDTITTEFLLGVLVVVIGGNVASTFFGLKNGNGKEVKPQ